MRHVAVLSLLLAIPGVGVGAAVDSATATDTTATDAPARTALVVHGGAGVIQRSQLSADDEAAVRADLDRALDAGHAVLAGGGTALDAVTAAVLVLEDSPRFNAGKGAVYNALGEHELDASVMEGHSSRAGAVAGVRSIRNPVLLARKVMEDSPHVLLMGAGAETFADEHPDIQRVENSWFDTPQRLQQLQRARQAQDRSASVDAAGSGSDFGDDGERGRYFGTVGAVALDAHGHIAAATSTGGMNNKRWGRVGDAPLIGAGTYANAQCGVSATGWGEYFIRAAVAHDICARMAYRGDSLKAAAEQVIMQRIPEMGGDGGVIALDRDGNIALPFNTPGMYRGWIGADGSRGTAIFAD